MRGYVPKKINYYSLPNKTDIFDRFEVKTIKNNKKDIKPKSLSVEQKIKKRVKKRKSSFD
jgi:hypothetical protein